MYTNYYHQPFLNFHQVMNYLLPFIVILGLIETIVSKTRTQRIEITSSSNPIFLNETYYTGFLPLDSRGSLFFWLFESRNDVSKDPLVVWLTGGPGCSSEIALLVENGPYKVNSDNATLKTNPYSWNNIANVLYVDQPLGTGFSTATDLDQNETQIAIDFYTFLQEFLNTFPDYKGRDFFITGESYAGHYIPAMAAYIVEQGGLDLNFVGVGIGNGLVSVYYQYPAYADFAYENQLIDETLYKKLQVGFELCDNLIRLNQSEAALVQCQLQFERIIGKPPKFNVYDIREPCSYPPLCYDFGFADDFLLQDAVEQAIGVTGRPWAECNQTVHIYLSLDFMDDLTQNLTYLIDKGLNVLLYHGDKDFICNWRGGEVLTNNLDWSGKYVFQNQSYTTFEDYGEYKHVDNFTFYRVYNAGHMVPMDQPLAALTMLERFINGW